LKYLLYKEDKISARELESHLAQSFPAIKKQIDNLEKAGIVEKNKLGNRWQLQIKEDVREFIESMFVFEITYYIKNLNKENGSFLYKYFLVDFFNKNPELPKMGVDLVFIYQNDVEENYLTNFKEEMSSFLDSYFLDLKISFMDFANYEKRLKFADKFVIKLSKFENFIFK
jgi:predicted transcriptional regulator